MVLTHDNLVLERIHSLMGGRQLLYRIGDYGLSCVNPSILHSYPFAWEVATIKYKSKDPNDFDLVYDTGLTDDVEVFDTDEETNAFLKVAFDRFNLLKDKDKKKEGKQ